MNKQTYEILRPLADNVIVERLEVGAVSKGGIVLPDSAKEKPQRGIVIRVGEGKQLEDGSRGTMQVNEGDEVFFTDYASTEIKINDKTYLIMEEASIRAIVEKRTLSKE